MIEQPKKTQAQQDKEKGSMKRPYESPTLLDEEVFERAVYASCKMNPGPPKFCNPMGGSSG